MRKLVYLASPYSNDDPLVREIRYHRAMRALHHLITAERDYQIFSPIVHTHEATKTYGMPKEFGFWRDIDFDWVERCDEVWVLMLDGWAESVGLQAETKVAKVLGKPILYWHFTCTNQLVRDEPREGVVYPLVITGKEA